MTPDPLASLREWLAGRDAIHELAVEWPPGSKVRAREGVTLMVPAPGVKGTIESYFESGDLGVVAPMAHTLTSPITGLTAYEGEPISGACSPDQLELVEYGPFTPDDVRAAIS